VLYGRGSQGGIVNRVSKAPEHGRRSTIEAQAGSEDLRSLYADLSADPSDTVSLRLNMGNQDNNSFRDGVDGSRQLFAPSISWQINPDLNWLVQYEYSRYNRTRPRHPRGQRPPGGRQPQRHLRRPSATTSTTAPSRCARA
jgi:iron complex outermembrane receptor protein